MLRPDFRSCRSGLTLIEVLVALGVMVILVSGIYMVVQTSLKTVLLIDTRASREDEISHFIDIFRTNFRNLPARAALTAEPVTGGKPEMLIVIRNAPGFMTWLAQPGPEDEVVMLSLRRDSGEERWRVCLKRFTPALLPTAQELSTREALKAAADLPWLELVGDIEEIKLRFFDLASSKWLDVWKNSRSRPALIKLTLAYEHAKDPRSSTAVFWLPPVKGGAL